jgi:hypothetical protein
VFVFGEAAAGPSKERQQGKEFVALSKKNSFDGEF